MLKTYKKESPSLRTQTSARAGNLEYGVRKIRGVEYSYFRIGRTVAQRSGLAVGDKVIFQADPQTGYGIIKPDVNGWTLQSGDVNAENPPLVLRITRRPDHPYLDELGQCKAVKAGSHSLEFYFPDGTIFKEDGEKEEPLYQHHKELIEGKRIPRKGNGAPKTKYGKPYGRRATDI